MLSFPMMGCIELALALLVVRRGAPHRIHHRTRLSLDPEPVGSPPSRQPRSAWYRPLPTLPLPPTRPPASPLSNPTPKFFVSPSIVAQLLELSFRLRVP